MAQGRVFVKESTEKEIGTDGWKIAFQFCFFDYGNGNNDDGYRFIWIDPKGRLKASRGQARIPSIEVAEELIAEAKRRGWG